MLSLALVPVSLPSKAGIAALAPQADQQYPDMCTDCSIFCIGPNKAGTTSLKDLFDQLPGSWAPCHDNCEGGREWHTESTNHNGDSPVFQNHRAFMDNGDRADFEYLYDRFPTSRFIMNGRGLYDWVLSRFDMIREVRESAGCLPWGLQSTCMNATMGGIPTGWTGNADTDLYGWILDTAETQRAQMDFFQDPAHPERLNRFVIVNMESEGCTPDMMAGCIHDTLTRIHWAARTDLNQYTTTQTLQLGVPLPPGADQNWPSMPQSLPQSLVGEHYENSRQYVKDALARAGCTENTWTDIMYTACSRKIVENKMQITYPSATGCTERCAMRIGLHKSENSTVASSAASSTSSSSTSASEQKQHRKGGRS